MCSPQSPNPLLQPKTRAGRIIRDLRTAEPILGKLANRDDAAAEIVERRMAAGGLPLENFERVKIAVHDFISALGFDPDDEAFRETPTRVAKLCGDVLDYQFSSGPGRMTSFEEAGYDETAVQIVNVPFYSFCAHHLLPFFGTFSVAYVPKKKLLGLSKLVRCVRHPSKKPTTQEELTRAAVENIMTYAEPAGAIVWMQAEHMCMTLRGVKATGCRTITIAHRGVYTDDTELRGQFLEQCNAQ